MPLSKKFCLFRKLVKDAKWWSKSTLPLFHSPDHKMFPFKKGFKKSIGFLFRGHRKLLLTTRTKGKPTCTNPVLFNPSMRKIGFFGIWHYSRPPNAAALMTGEKTAEMDSGGFGRQ